VLTTINRAEPSRRDIRGPYRSERSRKAWWMSGLRRWRCPIIGIVGGLGGWGKCGCDFLFLLK